MATKTLLPFLSSGGDSTDNQQDASNNNYFTRRVSFNNLHPDSSFLDLTAGDDHPMRDSTAVYPSAASTASSTAPNQGHNIFTNLLNGNSNYTHHHHHHHHQNKKRIKLPDPPSKSILKNKLSPEQLYYNIQHSKSLGINYHEELNDLVSHPPESVPRSDVIFDMQQQEQQQQDDQPRRKSYSQMTDEELMALDPQFSTTKSKVSNVEQFKFDSQKTYYLPARKSGNTSSLLSTAASAIKQPLYPSSNENNYKSISLTVTHRDYSSPATSSASLSPPSSPASNNEISTRTILAVVSGRRHTWNTLDWLLLSTQPSESRAASQCFLNHGDHLVVSSLIPIKFMRDIEAHNQRYKNYSNKQINLDEVLYNKCSNLLNYIISQLPCPQLRLKITVEFVIDVSVNDALATKKTLVGQKYMLSHLYKQYSPTLIVVGNKSTNLNFKYPLRISRGGSITEGNECAIESGALDNKFLIKLSSYIVKYSTIPVIVVGNATKFHDVRQKSKSNRRIKFKHPNVPRVSILEPAGPRRTQGDSSSPSNSSDSSLSPTATNSKVNATETPGNDSTESSWQPTCQSPEFRQQLSEITDLPNTNPGKFAGMIDFVSQSSRDDANNYLSLLGPQRNPSTFEEDDPQIADTKIHNSYKSHWLSSTSQSSSSFHHPASRRGNSFSGINPSNSEESGLYPDSGLMRRRHSSNENGGSSGMYKVKSLISYDEEDERKNERMINSKRLSTLNTRSSASSAGSSSGSPPLDRKTSAGSVKDIKNKVRENAKANAASGDDTKKVTKKKSFLSKIGLKKN